MKEEYGMKMEGMKMDMPKDSTMNEKMNHSKMDHSKMKMDMPQASKRKHSDMKDMQMDSTGGMEMFSEYNYDYLKSPEKQAMIKIFL